MSSQPLKRFELENNVQDLLFQHDKQEQKDILAKKPWLQDPTYFKDVKMSCIALLKILIHARKGDNIEVMGSLQGRIKDRTIYILDSFELPVEGTETRVSAQNEGYEYMVQYVEQSERVGRLESVVGWYHSHPGYGCWLSGIDVGTQKLNQTYSEPFVAIVIDPKRTISAGKVEIGAFRTYPEGYKPSTTSQEYQSIPLNKIEDFGVHCNSYYQLEMSFFKSSLDTELLNRLWNKYWISTLSSSVLVSNWEYSSIQIKDLASKIDKSQSQYIKSNIE